MTVTIHKEENDQRELQLRVEVSEDQVEEAMRRKARELGRELRFPGFRRGKVPYRVIIQRLGRDAVRSEAVDDMVQSVFLEALDEADVDPYAQPILDDIQSEPLVLQFTIPLEPVVTLGADYREMRREIEPVEVSDEALEEALEQVQIQHQTVEPVDRPVEAGDLVTVNGQGVLLADEDVAEDDEAGEAEEGGVEEGGVEERGVEERGVEEREAEDGEVQDREFEILFDEEHLDLLMDDKKLFPGTPFVENLIGLSVGEETTFEIIFPDDYEEEDLAGRTASFDLSILEVKKRDLPPLDDDLAQLDGDYETLEEMRAGLKERLQKEAENQAKEDLIESTIDELLEDAELNYPPAAVESEIEEMLDSFKNQVTRSGWEFEDFLTIQGSTEDSIREDFRGNAEERLQRRLVLRQFMLAEKLRVQAADVETLIDERTGTIENEDLRKQMHDFYMQGAGFDMISSEVLSNKVYERIVDILSGNAPDLDALEEEEADTEEE